MKKPVLVGILILFQLFSGAQTRLSELPEPLFVPGEVVVRFAAGTPMLVVEKEPGTSRLPATPGFSRLRDRFELSDLRQMVPERSSQAVSRFGEVFLLRFGPGADIYSIIQELKADPSVVYAEPNYVYQALAIPNDPEFAKQWGLHNTGSTGKADADIDAPEAWDLASGSDAVIAISDTGIDLDHPDLVANLWINKGEIAGNKIDDDGNGFVDDVNGYDFVNDDGNPDDDHYHGTHVAGIVGARGNNGVGVTGVSQRCRLMAVKGLSAAGFGSSFNLFRGIIYAAENGAQVINMSWGRRGNSSLFEQEVLEYAVSRGVLPVAAAGNADSQALFYPAAYGQALAVASTDDSDRKSSFSNFGLWVDISAPGSSIYSTLPNGSYGYLSGTSMATPMVCGIAGLLLGVNPQWNGANVASHLLHSVENVIPGYSGRMGTGRVNAYRAVSTKQLPVTPAVILLNGSSYGWSETPRLQAGSSYSLRFNFANYGSATLQDVALEAAGWGDFVTVLNSPQNLGILPAGSSLISPAFQVQVASNAPHLYSHEMWLRVSDENASVRLFKIPFLVVNPAEAEVGVSQVFALENTSFSLANNNGAVDPGERITLVPYLRNRKDLYVQNITGELVSADAAVEVPYDDAFYNDLAPYGFSRPYAFVFHLLSNAGRGREYDLLLRLYRDSVPLGTKILTFVAGDSSLPAPRVRVPAPFTNRTDRLAVSSNAIVGAETYEYSIGTTPGTLNVRNWTRSQYGPEIEAGSLSLTEGQTYYVSVRARRGNTTSNSGTSSGITVDLTPPSAGTLSDADPQDKDVLIPQDTLSFSWSGFTDNHGLRAVRYSLGTSAGAQDIVPWNAWSQLLPEGMPANWVYSVAATRDRLWVATGAGVGEFDGNRWILHTLRGGSLSSQSHFFVSSAGHVYVMTGDGRLARYDGKGWIYYNSLSGPGSSVTGVAEDAKGTLWIGTSGGLYAAKDLRVKARSDLVSSAVTALSATRGGNVLAATSSAVFEISTAEQLTKVYQATDSATSIVDVLRDASGRLLIATTLPSELVVVQAGSTSRISLSAKPRKLFEDKAGQIWISEDQLAVFQSGRVTRVKGEEAGYWPSRVAQSADGRLWVGHRSGLSSFRNGVWQVSTNRRLPDSTVYSLFVDAAGTLWTGTLSGLAGWSRTDWTRYPTQEGPWSPAVKHVYRDSRNRLWAATENLFYRLEGTTLQSVPEVNDVVSQVYESSTGQLFALGSRAVFVLENDRWRRYDPSDGSSAGFSSIEEFQGTIYLGASAGLFTFEKGVIKAATALSGSSLRISDLQTAPGKGLFISSLNGDLWQIIPGFNARSVAAGGFGKRALYSLAADRDGVLWIGSDAGLFTYVDGEVRMIDDGFGLRDRTVLSLHIDSQQNVYVGTSGGGIQIFHRGGSSGQVELRPGFRAGIKMYFNLRATDVAGNETVRSSDGIILQAASNPAPTLASLLPSNAMAGASGTNITIVGSNFVPSAVVRWNGVARTTTFFSSSQLSAFIPASDIGAARTAQVTVSNPSPGGGVSAALTFTIRPAENYFSQFGNGANFVSSLILTNPSRTESAAGTVSFLNDQGRPLSVSVNGQPAASTVSFSISPLGAATFTTDGRGELAAGSARVSSNTPLAGVVRFTFPSLGIAGVGESAPLRVLMIPVTREASRGLGTAIAITNIQNSEIELKFSLRGLDGSEVSRGSVSQKLEANGHLAKFVHELLPSANTASFQGTLLVSSTTPGARIAATAIQLGSSAGQFTTLPVVPVSPAPTTKELVFAQFGNGAGFTSTLFLINPLAVSADAELTFFDDPGKPLAIPLVGKEPSERVFFSVSSLGAAVFTTDGQGDLVVGSARVSSSSAMGGVLQFAFPNVGIAGVGAGVPTSAFITPVARSASSGLSTGVAVTSMASPVRLTFTLRNRKGETVQGGQVTLQLPAKGHVAKFVHELFADALVQEFEGTLTVSSEGGEVAGTAIQLGSRSGEFTTLPVTPVR